ncbi:alpha/beta hydrolase [Cyclobacterium jeungdonense]|uniref:Alpha/beta hydrolase n=1 Tax=Cyclobacterium jeungdonense TaxID=708087 RepID=A0ABT8C844_9BACT|nr:alpha/beta hydrolase [Cyclobacterium jeungdonense]MDN3688939.1 alpha/beta hydrolase [Cyclobacterium jeungdonense]
MIKYLSVIMLVLAASCSFKGITVSENITYMEEGFLGELPEKQLNVFAPKNANSPLPVLVFIHGGSWRSGSKERYGFFGRRMARRDIVTVIIDYPLSPQYQIQAMALATAKSLDWVASNIEGYGGDPERIVVSGHSAGGHLAALVAIRDTYFDSLEMESPVTGAALIDAAGLDMYHFLVNQNYEPGTSHLKTFTNDPNVWKETSPIYYLHGDMPPMLIMIGGKTYPSILEGTARFMDAYKDFVPKPDYKVQRNKRHIPMMVQFLYTPGRAFRWVRDFVKEID